MGNVDKQKGGQSGGGLKIAGSGPNGREDDGIGVMMSMDKDESTRRAERDAEAAAKRQQNALPAWHLKSTISGDLTALGVAENARAVNNERAGEGAGSNDDILRGLGTVGPKGVERITPAVVEEVKPVVNVESDCELVTSFNFIRRLTVLGCEKTTINIMPPWLHLLRTQRWTPRVLPLATILEIMGTMMKTIGNRISSISTL